MSRIERRNWKDKEELETLNAYNPKVDNRGQSALKSHRTGKTEECNENLESE